MTWSQGYQRPISPAADTARVLVLIGIVLEAIFVFIFLGLGALFLLVSAVLGGFLLVAGVIGLLILYLVYAFTYVRIRDGNYAGARTTALIWAILALVTLSIITAILFFVAYYKLGQAVRESQPYPYSGGYGTPGYPPVNFPGAPVAAGASGTIPAGTNYVPGAATYPAAAPVAANASSPGPVSPCPRCGNPLTFIPQYGRWYCYHDQTYV